MFKIFRVLLAMLLFFMASSAMAADEDAVQNFVTAEIPIFSQKLRFKIPTDWQHAQTNQSETAYLIEFIPKDETIDNWKNLFSLQGIRNFNLTVSPEQVADSVASNFANTCPNSVIYNKLGARILDEQNAFLAIIGCSNLPNDHQTNLKAGMSEISYYVFVAGQHDLYIAHKSIRGAGFTGADFPPFVAQSIKDMLNFFPIEFCSLDSELGQCNK